MINFWPVGVGHFGKPLRDDAFCIRHKNNWHCDAIPGRIFWEAFVDDVKRFDDCRIRVGEKFESHLAPFGESRNCRDLVVTDRRDVIAEVRELIDPLIPGDRLVFAVGSPIQGSGKKQNEAASP